MRKVIAGLMLAIGVAALLWIRLAASEERRPDSGNPTPGGTEAPSAQTPAGPAHAAQTPVPSESATTAPGEGRQALSAEEAIEECAQGIRGTVVDGSGRPVANAGAYLLEAVASDPVAHMVAMQHGVTFPATATATSRADGSFAVGVRQFTGRHYELRVLAAGFADLVLGDLQVVGGEWFDAGQLVMVAGTTIRGRVTMQGEGEGARLPIPQAVVAVAAASTFADLAERVLPGREHGLVALTDANGRYELPHAPAQGVVMVSAAASGFARVVKNQVELRGQAVDLDFELPRGLTVTGDVVTTDGRPLAGARIDAWPETAGEMPYRADTGRDGRFELVGLRDGNYTLRVQARDHQTTDQRGVAAGSSNVHCVLVPRGGVAVRVHTPDGAPVRDYQLGVRRWFAENGGEIGAITDLPDQHVRLEANQDAATVRGLDRSSAVAAPQYVVQVTADGWAKTLSAPFSIAENGPDAEVDVTLSRGTVLMGTVVDESGRGIAGAEVATAPDGAADDNVVWRMLASMTPDRITRARATTAGDGSFRLPLLATARYQLEVAHADYCRGILAHVAIAAEAGASQAPEVVHAPPIVLHRGAIVRGRALVDGRPTAQVRVVLTAARTAIAEGTAPTEAQLRLEAISNNDGVFVMPRRVPPGTWELSGARKGAGDGQTDILRQILQLQKAAVTFTTAPGQVTADQDLNLNSDH